MFAVFYITVALLQLIYGQEVTEYYQETQEDMPPISVEDNGDILTTAAETPLSGKIFKEEDSGESEETPIDTVFDGTVNAQETVTIAANYECGESCCGPSDEEEEISGVVKVAPKTIIRLSSPVKTEGKVTIVAYIGCEAEDKEIAADDEDVNEPIIISASSPVRAQGKVSIAAHYGCDENSMNIKTPLETIIDDIDVAPASFGGSVHAQGKVSVGTQYGCGAPFGIPPIFLPMPWFPNYPIYLCPAPYPTSGSLSQYPIHEPETGPFTTPRSQDSQERPIASVLENSVPRTICAEVENNDFQHENMGFNGIIPACGKVSIAARY